MPIDDGQRPTRLDVIDNDGVPTLCELTDEVASEPGCARRICHRRQPGEQAPQAVAIRDPFGTPRNRRARSEARCTRPEMHHGDVRAGRRGGVDQAHAVIQLAVGESAGVDAQNPKQTKRSLVISLPSVVAHRSSSNHSTASRNGDELRVRRAALPAAEAILRQCTRMPSQCAVVDLRMCCVAELFVSCRGDANLVRLRDAICPTGNSDISFFAHVGWIEGIGSTI